MPQRQVWCTQKKSCPHSIRICGSADNRLPSCHLIEHHDDRNLVVSSLSGFDARCARRERLDVSGLRPLTDVSLAQNTNVMKITVVPFALALVAAWTTTDSEASLLATRLATLGGPNLSKEDRAAYVDCGKEALSALPKDRLRAALKATDAPAIWKVLGGHALDQYVNACREVGQGRVVGRVRGSAG